MLAFTSTLPVCGSTVQRNSTPPSQRRRIVAVLETPHPTSIDQLVLRWFSSRNRGAKRRGDVSPADDEPMSGAISGPLLQAEGQTHYLLSTNIVSRVDAVGEMKSLLKQLLESSVADGQSNGLLQCVVNQAPDDPPCFLVFERFASAEAMTKHQKGEVYRNFIRQAQPLLEKPLGVHICKEINGKVSQAFHPFGPAGEGGRDDMIYGIGQSKS